MINGSFRNEKEIQKRIARTKENGKTKQQKNPTNTRNQDKRSPEEDLGEKALKSRWRQPQYSQYTGKEERIKSNLDNAETRNI